MFYKEVTEMINRCHTHLILIDRSINPINQAVTAVLVSTINKSIIRLFYLTDVLLQIVIILIFILAARVGRHCRSVGTGGGEEDRRHFLPTVLNAAQ